jgi:hypothetical protein
MELKFSVPSEKIKLLFSLIKKVAKTTEWKRRAFVYFSVNGIYAIAGDIHLCVPVPLEMDISGFVMCYTDIEKIQKSDGDVITFSVQETAKDVSGEADNIESNISNSRLNDGFEFVGMDCLVFVC